MISNGRRRARRSVLGEARCVVVRFKQRKSLTIIVTAEHPLRAARNLSGVDIVTVDQLNVEHLAPGMLAGRLTIWTESALVRLEGR